MSKIIRLTESDLVRLVKRVLAEETEMTEACWKGYTQKGMKTMFGKKYPNCVKKESVGEEIEVNIICPDDNETQVSVKVDIDSSPKKII